MASGYLIALAIAGPDESGRFADIPPEHWFLLLAAALFIGATVYKLVVHGVEVTRRQKAAERIRG